MRNRADFRKLRHLLRQLKIVVDMYIECGVHFIRQQQENEMLYHIETTNGVLSFDRNDADSRSIKQYFADKNESKPAPIAVKGYPFVNMYLTHGTEENGLFVAIKAK